MNVNFNNSKYRILAICLFLSLLVLPGYTFSERDPHIKIKSHNTEYTIYFSSSIDNKLVYDESNSLLKNISGSSQTGWMNIGNEQYSVTFPNYDIPYYYTGTGVNRVTHYLDQVTIISNSNVKLYESLDYMSIIGVSVVGLLFMIFLKR